MFPGMLEKYGMLWELFTEKQTNSEVWGWSSGTPVKVKNQISQGKLAILYTPLNFCYTKLPRPLNSNMVFPLTQERWK
jgi:hypothetical protein